MNIEHTHVTENTENINKLFRELPSAHIEHFDSSSIEGFSRQETCEKIGGSYYDILEKDAPGVIRGFFELSEEKGWEEFQKLYGEYVCQSEQLKERYPDKYLFMRNRVFYGREYAVEAVNLKAEQGQEQINFKGSCNRLDIIAGPSTLEKSNDVSSHGGFRWEAHQGFQDDRIERRE